MLVTQEITIQPQTFTSRDPFGVSTPGMGNVNDDTFPPQRPVGFTEVGQTGHGALD